MTREPNDNPEGEMDIKEIKEALEKLTSSNEIEEVEVFKNWDLCSSSYCRFLLAENERLEIENLGHAYALDVLRRNCELPSGESYQEVDAYIDLLKDREKVLQERCDALMEVVKVVEVAIKYNLFDDDEGKISYHQTKQALTALKERKV